MAQIKETLAANNETLQNNDPTSLWNENCQKQSVTCPSFLSINMSLTELPNQRAATLDFLSGGGEMGERIRNFDWSTTPLGPPATWEQSLKTCVRIMLTSPQPMFVWWGTHLINIYNDAYRYVLGEKHPHALGGRGDIIWKEIWDEVGKRAAIVFNKNEGTYDDGLLLIMNRFGFDEETYFKFSYNPIPGEHAVTAGLFCVCTEETTRIINERSLNTLRSLDAIAQKESEKDIYEQAASSLTFNNKDFPFGIIYQINDAEAIASPVAFIGIESNQKVFPTQIALTAPTKDTKNFCKAYQSKEILISENAGRRKNIPTGFWQVEATHFAHIPILIPGKENPVAILSTALNPCRKFDSNYKQLLQLVADRVAIEVNNVLNYTLEKKKAAELAELDEAKTIFFSNISHEFRTPLTLLLGNIEEALNEPGSLPKNIERMNMTHRNAMRLLKLVNTLLDFSRIESGRQKAIYSLTDISSLTKDLASNFRSTIEKAGLKFLVQADTVVQPVYIDRQMWEKIVFNLLSNAFKYTLEGAITVRLYADGNNVILEVQDTGAGIPEKELPNMFERFHRVDNTPGRTYEGTGIGLSLTKELVLLHKGSIHVNSKLGKGSTFIVTIPFGKDHLPAGQTSEAVEELEDIISDVYVEEAASLILEDTKPDRAPGTNGDLGTILVVDDNADMRHHIQSLLEKQFRIVTAVNGLEALNKIKTENPLLVISDIMMPIMDGIQLTKEIKENRITEHIPVILLTARAGEESKIQGYKIGADDYLVKPFSGKELTARIEAQIKIRQKRDNALQSIYKLFNEVPFAVAVLKGNDLVIEYINKYNLEIWQTQREDVIGKPLFDVRPDIRENVEHIHRNVQETGKRFRADEIQVSVVVDGKAETRFFDAIIDPMFDEDGNVIGQVATSIEVTDKVIARKKIKEHEEQLQLITNAVPSLISFVDKDLCYQYNNKAYEDWFGISANEIRGTSMKEVLGETAFNAIVPYVERVLAGEKVTFETKAHYKTGGDKHILATYVPHIDKQTGDTIGFYVLVNDITERKAKEEELNASEEKSRMFINFAPAAMAMFDKEMRYISASKQWLKEYDLDGDIIGKKHYELFPNILQRWKDVHARCMKGSVERSDEDFYVKDDGTEVWLKWDVHPWYDASDEIGGIVIFTENITERKKAKEVIRESEARFRYLFESNIMGVAFWNVDGNVYEANEAFLKVLGYSREDMENGLVNWRIFTRAEDAPIHESKVQQAIQGKTIDPYETVFTHKNGHQFSTLVGYAMLTGSKENGIAFLQDFSEIKMAQNAVRESEERFRTMANEAPLFVWETDDKLQTTYLNKAGFDYFDLDESSKMSELSWKEFIHQEDLDRVLNTMWDAVERKQSYTLEMRLKNARSGEYKWFLDKGAPRYANEKFTGFIGTSLEIHERKEVENELEMKVRERTSELDQQNTLLQKQNELVKKIFDASVDAISVYDAESKIITLNEAASKIFGKKPDALIGRKLLEILPQWEGSKGHKDLLKALNGETVHNKVYYSEVVERYYENFLMPLKDENDKVYAALVMAHDNTDLIRSAEKLNEAQQIAQIGHWDWDLATNQLTWSDNMYSIYGLDKEDGIDYDRFIAQVHPDDRLNMQSLIESALQTRTFNDFFHRIITPAGEEKIMHARGELVINKKGKILRMVGTGQDVTKQKLTEQELITTSKKIEERNEFIEQLINSSLDLIMVIDKDLRFITMNKKAQDIYKKYYQQDIIGKKITDFNPPLKGTENYNDLLEAFGGKVVIKDKVKSTISDRYFEHNYVPLTTAAGEVYAVMIISHDITQSIQQMEELRKLYESDEQKNNFIAMASHELKTPITSIKGYVQLLLNAVEKEKDRQKPLPPLLVRSSLISVDKQIKRLTRLISELLDISKIETGTLELKIEKFSLNELAIETVEDILYTNTKHEINLYHDHHSYVFGDKDRVGQVMINFLTNAIKYSPDSEKIDVTVHRAGKDEIAFSVRDYGIGIEKEEQKKIFERFYRAKGKEEQTYPGFGIGLFIAKEFIQKHGGRISVESEKGKGSVFSFILPVNSAEL